MGAAPLLAKHLPASARQPEQKRANPKSYGVRRVGREAVDLLVTQLDNRLVPGRDEEPRAKIPVLETLQRLLKPQPVGMKRSDFAIRVDVSIRQRPFHSSESDESASKLGQRFDIRGTGCGALGMEVPEVHFGTLRGWLIPKARSSGAGSGVFVGGCALLFAFAALSISRTGFMDSITWEAAVSALRVLAISGFLSVGFTQLRRQHDI